MTHPHHPWCGRTFEVVSLTHKWGEDRVYFHDDGGRLCTVSVQWTSLAPADAFVTATAGRSWFRVVDLLEAAALIARYRSDV